MNRFWIKLYIGLISSNTKRYFQRIYYVFRNLYKNLNKSTDGLKRKIAKKTEKTTNVMVPEQILSIVYRTRAILTRSWSETALVYKSRILGLKNEEFLFLLHKLSVI